MYNIDEFVHIAAERGYAGSASARGWAEKAGKTEFTEDDLIELYRAFNDWGGVRPHTPSCYKYGENDMWDQLEHIADEVNCE